MIHLLYSTLILCGALGATLSKTDKTTTIRKKRQRLRELSIGGCDEKKIGKEIHHSGPSQKSPIV